MVKGPLEGVLVLDVSEGIAGPFAARLLADYGADVIKVEPPQGERARREGPFPTRGRGRETSVTHLFVNANKRSITLNLESATGRDIFLRLVAQAQVLVESFPPGTLEAMGLGVARLQRENPALVVASVTPFGQTGPYRGYQGGHLVTAALGGGAYMLGEPSREPLQPGNDFYSFMTGVCALTGIVFALYQAQATGQGAWVDVCQYEAVYSTTLYPTLMVSYQRALAKVPLPPVIPGTVRRGNHFPGVFRCRDGYIGVYLLTQAHWEGLCRMAGKEELLSVPKYADANDRYRYGEELQAIFAPWFAERTREEIFSLGRKHEIPVAIINTPADLLQFPPFQEVGYFLSLAHPLVEELRYPRPPLRFVGEEGEALQRGAPMLGEHTEEVLKERLGLTSRQIEQLRRAGIV